MKHLVIYIPGLGDQNTLILGYQKLALKLWRLRGVRVEVMQMYWSSNDPFSKRFDELTMRIDDLSAEGYKVSLAGVSAGASAAILAFLHNPEKVHHVITICGKLRGTVGSLLRTTNPRFSESYDRLQAELIRLSESQKKKILTVYSTLDLYVDEPQATLPGIAKKAYKIPGHNLSSAAILIIGAKPITKFIKTDNLN